MVKHFMAASRYLATARTAPACIALALLAATGPTPLRAQASAAPSTPLTRADSMQLPTLGDGSEMSSSAERRLGDRIAREIYRDPDYIDDPVLLDYVQEIWQPLLAAARARGDLSAELHERFAWEIMLARDRTVNAFALPGGYLGVHLGLIAVVGSRDELASVLGHELSHVTQRHISRVMAKQSQQTPWLRRGPRSRDPPRCCRPANGAAINSIAKPAGSGPSAGGTSGQSNSDPRSRPHSPLRRS